MGAKIMSERSRLGELYTKTLRPELKEKLGFENSMAVPMVSKIVLNIGIKSSVSDGKVLQLIQERIGQIAGQLPVKTLAKKSVAGFKIREGMPIGVRVTLRKKNMYNFLDKLINLSLPRVRDFQGLSRKFDGRGNYNLGIKEWVIFPEADTGLVEKYFGFNITIHTTASSDEHGYELMKSFGMPFKKEQA